MELKLKQKLNKSRVKMKDFWLKLWKMLLPSQRQIKYLLVLIMVFESSKFISPYLLKKIIDLITNFTNQAIGKLLFFITLMFITDLVVNLIDYLTDKKIFRILVEAENYLSVNVQKKMVYLSLSYHEQENTGNKISKIQRGIDKIIDLLGNFFWDVGPTIIQVIFTATVLFFVDWRFGIIFTLFIPIFMIMTSRLNKIVYPYRKLRHDKYEEAAGQMTQSIININTVKSFVQEAKEVKNYSTIKDFIKRVSLIEFFKMLNYNYGRSSVITLGRILILLFGVYLVWLGNITIGSLVFIITITEKALISLFRISRLYDRIMDSSEAIVRLDNLNKEHSDIVNPVKGIRPKKIIGRIDFENVNFSYKGSKIKVLDNVNLKINSGCVTALVGPSGGGKTTVARMIYRHYDPTSGEVILDNENIKKYDLYGIRKFMAIVPQEVEIFNTSVKENIAYAKPNATIKEIEAAAKIANADEFVNKLSQGYNTLAGERGIKLSGGQRQRIGIARAVLANPKILIFDEATSNLDSYSEKLIQEALEKVSKGRTVIVIAHRLSTIRKADKIIVLEGGKVVEQGSHYELSRTNDSLYYKLLKLQAIGDVE